MLSCSLIGNLGSDPEMKYGQNGSGRLQMNVAVNQRTRVEGEWTEKTEWVRCTVFGARAESLANHLRKGMRVFVSGRLEARPWTSNQGEVRAGLEVIADTVEFFSTRQQDDERPAPVAARRPAAAAVLDEPVGDMDLPF